MEGGSVKPSPCTPSRSPDLVRTLDTLGCVRVSVRSRLTRTRRKCPGQIQFVREVSA
jgi:hypothetical protein